jgi:CDP-diglyceride synthetase
VPLSDAHPRRRERRLRLPRARTAWLALARCCTASARAEWLLFVFVLVWAADIGAFFVGRAVGRVRLARS